MWTVIYKEIYINSQPIHPKPINYSLKNQIIKSSFLPPFTIKPTFLPFISLIFFIILSLSTQIINRIQPNNTRIINCKRIKLFIIFNLNILVIFLKSSKFLLFLFYYPSTTCLLLTYFLLILIYIHRHSNPKFIIITPTNNNPTINPLLIHSLNIQ